MTLPAAFCLLLGLCGLAAADDPAELDPAHVEFFEQKIRPLLTTHCLDCHSGDSAEGGLRLDLRDGWMQGGDSGRVIKPGKPDESLMIRMVRNLPVRMPPENSLSEEQVADLVKWIELGAPDPRTGEVNAKGDTIDWEEAREHWAYQPVEAVEPPPLANARSAQPIDRFLAAQWTKAGVKPMKLADKYTLIRRASYTLTGLPPTLAEVRAFEADNSRDAFAKVVDRLLASPRYGEHQARQWLDVARFAEDRFSGSERPGATAHPYRDWVIRALNDDMPYDRFVKMQIAGDLISDEPRHRAALGFLALSPSTGIVNNNDLANAEA